MEPVISIENLRVEYRSPELKGQIKVALHSLNLKIGRGEVFGFLGPNGAGKTTTMNVLLGFVQPTSGSAKIFGVDAQEAQARARFGYLPELTYYYKFLTPEELLTFYGQLFGLKKASLRERIDRVLKLVELESVRKRQIRTFSKGMTQRIGIAQALINDPDLLILDEPTSGLDPIGRMKIRDIIQTLKSRGKTVFFASHELGEVETVCDRVAILSKGQLLVEGSVHDLMQRHQCNLEQIFLKVIGYDLQNPSFAGV